MYNLTSTPIFFEFLKKDKQKCTTILKSGFDFAK